MKLTRKTVTGVLYATLLLASASAPALTLGKLRGAALLGKGLDLAVTVHYAADEEVNASCFAAEVVYGENPVEASQLSVKAQAGELPNTQTVRIASDARVADAVVTVLLKTTCGAKAVRRYVLLADAPSDVLMPTNSRSAGEEPKGARSIVAAPSGTLEVGKPSAPVQTVKEASKPSTKLSPALRVPKKVVGDTVKPAPLPSSVNNEAIDALGKRVEDIEKWQAQTTVADDLLKSQERSKAFEADIAGLKTITAKNQQNLQTVATALEASESNNYGRPLVYALGLLLAVCAGALAYVVRGRNAGEQTSPWWSGSDSQKADKPLQVPTDGPVVAEESPVVSDVPPVPAKQPTLPATTVAPVTGVDIDLEGSAQASDLVPSAPLPVAPQAPVPLAPQEFGNSGLAHLRALNTQEMLDIRQQAEFFMALGQHDDAVHLLENSIQSSSDANPLVFLDLLKIFHTLARPEDFERYRLEFNQHFTGRVPTYAEFLSEGNGLDAYEDICQQIVVLWPTEYTVDFIEQCLVRTPEDDPEQGIDLEAFKDLLLLYGVLKRLDQTTDSGLIPFSTSKSPNTQMGLPEPAVSKPMGQGAENEEAAPLPSLAVPAIENPPVAAMDLDLDLSFDAVEPAGPGKNNLIDFDMSGFVKQEPGKESK